MMTSDEQFIKTWMQAHREFRTRAWVALQTGKTRQAVYWREKVMLKKGAQLPDLPKHGMSAEHRLNAIIERERES